MPVVYDALEGKVIPRTGGPELGLFAAFENAPNTVLSENHAIPGIERRRFRVDTTHTSLLVIPIDSQEVKVPSVIRASAPSFVTIDGMVNFHGTS